MRRFRRTAGVLAAALLTAGMPALAQGAGEDAAQAAPDSESDARRFFNAGQKAFDEGRYTEAAHAFEKAFKLKAHSAPLINAGDAWDKAGEYALAARSFQRVLNMKTSTEQDRVDATDRLARLTPKLGLIELSGAKTLRARIDDEEFRGGERVWLFPGEHEVALLGVDGSQVTKLDLRAGTERTVELSSLMPKRADAAPAPGGPAEPEDTGGQAAGGGGVSPLAWVAYGVGALGVIGTVVFGLQVNDAEAAFDADPTREDFDRFNSNKLLTNISLGVAVLGAGIGTTLLVIGLGSSKDKAALSPSPRFTLGAGTVGGGTGLLAGGRF